jgi:hypothetical protein
MAEPQNLRNHARYVPGYHLVLGILVFVYAFHALSALIHPSAETAFGAVLAVALVLMYWYERAFAVGVQDRVIRLEMRLRVREVAPDLAQSFDGLATGQVIALRFAGDDELPELMQQVLDGKLVRPGDIKAAIRHWKPDHQRI